MKNIGIYIHIPFCVKKCDYCDFNSFAGKDHLHEEYVNCLIDEMEMYKDVLSNINIDTIFIGGGTPTCLGAGSIEQIMYKCASTFNISPNAEISIEANPGTITSVKLRGMRNSGVNRLSFGLQSWNDEELKLLGRIHTKDEFIRNYELARVEGFDNINIDLMFALPDQDLKKWKATLDNVVTLNPEHISCYSLTIEEGTFFHQYLERGKIKLPDQETDRLMYENAINTFRENGYKQYEISNFSKQGYECRHNKKYWLLDEYIGFGAGAHSFIGEERYSNELNPEDYIKRIRTKVTPVKEKISLDKKDCMSEFIFLGLRLMSGININEFERRFGIDIYSIYKIQIDKFLSLNLLKREEDNIKLTNRGIDISNKIFSEFI